MSAIESDVRYGVDMTDRLAAHDAARRSAREAYDAVERPAWETYDAVERSAWEAYDAVRRSAWEALACGDLLVDWIIENASVHKVEAIEVLGALPATLAELDALAEAAEWCEKWDALRAAAICAGVIS